MTKLCTDCKHLKKDMVWVSPNERGYVPVCKHLDFVNPVDGSFLPPGAVRKEKEMCGITGKGWVQRTPEDDNDNNDDNPPSKPRILTAV